MFLTHPNLFTTTELTQAVQKLPLVVNFFDSKFEKKGVMTTKIAIDVDEQKINLVKDSPRSLRLMPAGNNSSKKTIILPCAHLLSTSTVTTEDVQDRREFGTGALVNPAVAINDKMLHLKNNVNATTEYHRLGAVRGKVLDADGSSVLYDLFDVFKVTQKKINVTFPTTTDTTRLNKVSADLNAGIRWIEQCLGGSPYSSIECICSGSFFDKLTGHDLVREAYSQYIAYQGAFGGDNGRKSGFKYAGITFFDASQVIGGLTQVEDGKAHLYPVGPGILMQVFGPADYMTAANTVGLEFYASMEPLTHNTGFSLEVQSNPLTYCTYPEALVELTAA